MEQERLLQARDIMVDAFGRVYAMFGMPEVVGRIYGLLFFSEQPLGLEDIASELEVSKATVSIHIRFLEGMKNVRKVWVKGSRRDYYEAERNTGKIMTEHLQSSFINEREITLEAAGRSREVLNDLRQSSDPAILQQTSLFGQYLDNLEEDYEWSLQFFKQMVEAWDKRQNR
ncbi:GbsR/MarR family transcriptional regulator [Syntrophomonas wolfei]|uniref:HTH-type transcriptional regulator n=1 Tax=Syntrophomonas wolfei subsp. wolfei (strain DSM 2245B / Goettingen) TaxID=335541 RepID=Q0AX78_SYNWW|nr:ArsR family transcriptional regulator [Syntrophomonas wolfei]ABI68676.1 transcriptional regulators-like protein [Syntrophomonas wolfei subsp. wolfei str. Goettingen G311]